MGFFSKKKEPEAPPAFQLRPKPQRVKEAARLSEAYPDRVPIVVTKSSDDSSQGLANLDKNKFLVPVDLSVAQFMNIMRKRMNLDSTQTFYVFFNGTLASSTDSIGTVFRKFKHEDGFLYAKYGAEHHFG